MRAVCVTSFFDGQQLFEVGKEYDVPKGFEMRFAIPKQKQLIDDKPEPEKSAKGK